MEKPAWLDNNKIKITLDARPLLATGQHPLQRVIEECATLQYGEIYEGDIRKVDPDTIPDFDLLTGGFPCQSFSIAGKRKGFEDTRGTLFYEIIRIAKAKKPMFMLLENVRGLASHDGGKTLEIILESCRSWDILLIMKFITQKTLVFLKIEKGYFSYAQT